MPEPRYAAVMNASAMVRGRGRPHEFDADEVLDRVIDLFWSQGYEATSVADLAEVSGLNKSSIYNTFGSKEQLFQSAIERYVEAREAKFHVLLRDGTGGLDDVHRMLGLARQEADAPLGWRGCMAVNTATLGGREPAMTRMSTRFRDEIRISFRAALQTRRGGRRDRRRRRRALLRAASGLHDVVERVLSWRSRPRRARPPVRGDLDDDRHLADRAPTLRPSVFQFGCGAM